MDDMKISLSVPATIYSFGETKSLTNNKYVTHAKLKVFYVGKTGDKRVFTKQFSDQLLQTLPGTPVVAYYDEEKEDFRGHYPMQYVFGYVPEAATVEYVQEGSNTFAVSDVLLFTGRNDNIGYVAQKIIGHSHSLELDPQTVEYTIVRANNTIDSITFNKGHFIGLSVLGNDEKPAFNGSAFFTEDTELETFVNSFKEFKREVELYKSGGEEMLTQTTSLEPENVEVASEIAVETGAPIVEEVAAVAEEMPVEETQKDDDTQVVEAAPMIEDEEKPMDEDEMPMEEEKEEEEETETEYVESTPIVDEVVEAQVLEGTKEDVRKETKENSQADEKISDATALNAAERQELNEYRKKAKFELIESYSDLPVDVREKFRNSHDKFTVEALDKELAYELVKSQRQHNKGNGIKVFAVITEQSQPETLADVINRYKDKH